MKPLPQSIEPQLTPTSIYANYKTLQYYDDPNEHFLRGNNRIIYSCTFVHGYLVGCTSNGMICVWNVHGGNYRRRDVVGKKRSLEDVGDGSRPVLW
jgi:hypothetical protein